MDQPRIKTAKACLLTFCMIGRIASPLVEDEAADAKPLGICESGTLMGLCRLPVRFFCDLPMIKLCDGELLKKKMLFAI